MVGATGWGTWVGQVGDQMPTFLAQQLPPIRAMFGELWGVQSAGGDVRGFGMEARLKGDVLILPLLNWSMGSW